MPLEEVILKSTRPADVAVFRLERGEFGFVDSDKLR